MRLTTNGKKETKDYPLLVLVNCWFARLFNWRLDPMTTTTVKKRRSHPNETVTAHSSQHSCQWNSKGEETDFFVKMCSVRKKARLHIEEPAVTSNPLYMAEIIEKICTFLHPRDLKRCQRVNRTWYRVSTRELHFRKLALVSFRYGMSWINSSKAKSLFR